MTAAGGYVWLEGRLLPAAEARLAFDDAGFLLGDGLFETMRIYHGRVLDLDRHLARLGRSARAFRLALPAAETLARGVDELIQRNRCAAGFCRLTVSRGRRPPGAGLPFCEHPTVLIHTGPLPRHAAEGKPTRLATATVRIDPASPLAGHKTTSFLPHLWARQEAADRGADEALLLDLVGRPVECATANLFAVRSGQVVTPPLAAGCLPGIVRSVVLELCSRLDIPAIEEFITLEELRSAEEVFITSSLREVAPVAEVEGARLALAPGPVTCRLIEAYRARAGELTGGGVR